MAIVKYSIPEVPQECEMRNNDKTIATYETRDAKAKQNCNRGTDLEESVGELLAQTRTQLFKNNDVISERIVKTLIIKYGIYANIFFSFFFFFFFC